METRGFWVLDGVSDDGLRVDLARLVASGCRTEARIVAHLAAFDERRLYLSDGFPSLFEYCLTRLGLSNSEAFHRITAARVARRFPVVFELLEQRRVHLTAICLLRDHLTADNHRELLAEAEQRTKWQVQELIARRFPSPDVKSGVRALARVEPLSEQRYRIQLNASESLWKKLEHLRDLLSHSIPSGDLVDVVERALDFAIERVEKQRFAKTAQPRAVRGATLRVKIKRGRQREHLANATRRVVAERDDLRCSFCAPDGRRCSARAFLQFHHEQPWARGGGSDVGNLKLLCAAHNRLLAERDFGAGFVAQRQAEARATSAGRSESRARDRGGRAG